MKARPVHAGLLRIPIAGLTGAIGGIHIDLWIGHGYRHIPVIGPLFLLVGVAGAVLAVAGLAVGRRALPLAWLASAGFAASTLVAVVVSLNWTLFGFSETTGAPLLGPSIGLEAVTVVSGLGGAAWQTVGRMRRVSAGDDRVPVDLEQAP